MPIHPDWSGVPVYSVFPPFPSPGMTSTASRIRLAQAEGDRLVNRLKNTNLDKYHTLCKMHLSFLLHLPGSSLDEFLSDGGAAWGSGGMTPSSEKSKFRHFGKKKTIKEIKLPEQLAITHETIDQILPLIDYLNNECNLQQEGLFRKSGHIGRQKLLREKLQNGEDVRMELESGIYSAHDCASVLKAFLSELQEPVLTERHYLAHCQIPEMDQEKKQLQTIQLLLQLIPSENLFLLRCLLTLLQKVALESENKMTSETLGTLFAPHLLVPRKMSANELQAVAADLTKTVAFMIDNAQELFKLPQPLVRDIATYWAQMETPCTESTDDHIDHVRLRYNRRVNPSDVPIHTSITFADRHASQQAASKTDTQIALAQLYAHVSSMPESAKKRRLLKQFNKANGVTLGSSPAPGSEKHKRTKSFGDSIKKIVGRNHRRRGSSHSLQIQQEIQNQENTPFSVNIGKYTSQSSQLLEKAESKKESDKCDDTGISGADGASDTVEAYHGPMLKLPLLPKSSVQSSQPSAVTSYIAKLRQRKAASSVGLLCPTRSDAIATSSAINTSPCVPRIRGKLEPISTAVRQPSTPAARIKPPGSPLLGLIRRRSFKNKESQSPGTPNTLTRRPSKKNRVSDSPPLDSHLALTAQTERNILPNILPNIGQ